MSEILVTGIKKSSDGFSADIIVDKSTYNVWYRFYDTSLIKATRRPANAFMIVALLAAMRENLPLRIDGTVSSSIYEQMGTYQDILSKWHPNIMHRVDIIPKEIADDVIYKNQTKSASTFTAGVDSFYTLLKHQDELDKIVYARGLDIPVEFAHLQAPIIAKLKEVARSLNLDFVEVDTNVKEFTERFAEWGVFAFGPGIASIALLMNGDINHFYIPSCNDYSSLEPRGSHIMINHLWSADGTRFYYDGAEASRIEKVARISKNQLVRDYLRVCYQCTEDYNCSVCEKCVRTMVSLAIVDDVDNFKTFNKPLVIDNISAIKLENESELEMAKDSRDMARQTGKHNIADQLDRQISNYQRERNDKDKPKNSLMAKVGSVKNRIFRS